MLMFGLNEAIDQLYILSSVHWHGLALRWRNGYVLVMALR